MTVSFGNILTGAVGVQNRQKQVCQGVKRVIYTTMTLFQSDEHGSRPEGQRRKQQPLNVTYKSSYLQLRVTTTHFMSDKAKATALRK
jgi:hypothetical protein